MRQPKEETLKTQKNLKTSENGLFKNQSWIPDNVIVHRKSLDTPYTSQILQKLANVNVQVIETTPRFQTGDGCPNTLYLLPQKSQFIKQCPGTHGYYICW